MEHRHITLAGELGIRADQVTAVQALLAEGATIPFISRYRKEATGQLDEVRIMAIRDRLADLAELAKRRQAVIASLQERELLTDSLAVSLNAAATLTQVEDLYLPFRLKRKTRATAAREKGLEPLATALFSRANSTVRPADFLPTAEAVADLDEALAGARDIMAEWISEDRAVRSRLRELFAKQAILSARVVEKNREKAQKFQDYFEWQEPAAKVAGHRLLAMYRGEEEKMLSLACRPAEEKALELLNSMYLRPEGLLREQMFLAVKDSYQRLLAPSLENELRSILKARADQEAIAVFTDNLRVLLLAPPLGQQRVMALDPGFRTGSKLVCLDETGRLLHTGTIHPLLSAGQRERAAEEVLGLCRRFAITAIAIGNGTAGRETEAFVRELDLPDGLVVTMVDESGASIYSVSEVARTEFPDHDVTVRGAVSIGRRLQDPLAELVKLDPKSIGVGQYQHDVNQKALRGSLDDTVESCVNSVGVELNTASVELLAFVSGLGPVLAKNITIFRNEKGPFTSRRQLLKVPRLGAKAYEQCAGFLRIRGGKNRLDNTAVHPERYPLLERMAHDQSCTVDDLIDDSTKRKGISLARYISADIGQPTLEDIMAELARPGRDPRETFTVFAFAAHVHSPADLEPGMVLPGIVTNVTKFGAFVDIGVHQDGLVHISQLADRYIKDPGEVVRVRQQVRVRVLEIDQKRKRIALSFRDT